MITDRNRSRLPRLEKELFELKSPGTNVLEVGDPELIQKWLPSSLKSKSLKLAYSGSRDGDTKEAFLSKCGGKGPLLYVVKATDGHRLGGYRSVKVDSSKWWREDKTVFLFSLTEGEVARLTGKRDKCVIDSNRYRIV